MVITMEKPYVEKEKCVGCGACIAICPSGFKLKDGKSYIKDPSAKCLKKAQEICPVGAIKL